MTMTHSAKGQSKYGPEAKAILEAKNASAVLVLVVSGNKSDGVTLCVNYEADPAVVQAALPGILRTIADEIEKPEFVEGIKNLR